jgi:hypothetical protein
MKDKSLKETMEYLIINYTNLHKLTIEMKN